jgi:hypothetical protein
MFRDEAKYLKEWVEYHNFIGVEHFWLYNNRSVDNWQDALKEYIDVGLVEVIDWEAGDIGWGGGFVEQPAIYRDGIIRAKGITKWLAIIDLDEFIVPMKELSLTECLEKHYQNATAIYVNWRNFGTGGVTIPEGGSLLYHLTACSLPGHPQNEVGKCIVRPEKVVLQNIWTPHHFEIESGGQYFNGKGEPIPMKEGIDHLADGLFHFGGKHYDKYLRINHYKMRDEYFFWNYRYKRCGEPELLLEHYESYNRVKDTSIWRFLRKMHPEYFPPVMAKDHAK